MHKFKLHILYKMYCNQDVIQIVSHQHNYNTDAVQFGRINKFVAIMIISQVGNIVKGRKRLKKENIGYLFCANFTVAWFRTHIPPPF